MINRMTCTIGCLDVGSELRVPYAVVLNEIECDISTPSGKHWAGRNVYKWFPANEEADIKTTWSGTVTTYSKLGTITQQVYHSDVFHVFANADECDMHEESLRRLLCSSGTLDGARGLINQDAWDLAIYLYTVTDRKQYQGLGMECTAAPTVCACLFGRNNLSGLMALKKVCMYSDLTDRHGVRTKEAGVLGLATLHIQQMCARGVSLE